MKASRHTIDSGRGFTGFSRLLLNPCSALLLIALFEPLAFAKATGQFAQIQNVSVDPDGENLKISITLSAVRDPKIVMANNPQRLILEFSDTVADARQQRIPVETNGVAGVWVGLNNPKSRITQVVLDLTEVHSYSFSRTGNTVVLRVLPQSEPRTQRAAAAAPSPLLGVFFRRQRRPAAPADTAQALPPHEAFRTAFRVKSIAQGEAYLDGGRRAGLSQGMTLLVRDNGTDQKSTVAELRVISVADKTSVTRIENPSRDVKPGDWAYLSAEAIDAIITARRALPTTPSAANSALEANSLQPQEQSQRTDQGHIRGRFGFDNSGIRSSGSTPGQSNTTGFMVRADVTRILGTHWNLQGYWRTRFTRSVQPQQNAMEYYLDRNYIMQLTYDNPDSRWVAGFGRLYLPFATVLDTIDGGYVGQKVGKGITVGGFFGSVPDVNSWHYSPDQRIAGSFVNFEGGDYDALHYSSTLGTAFGTMGWKLERPYGFLENSVSYKRLFSVDHSFVVDSPQGLTTDGITPGTGVSRSYLTLHVQPFHRIGFDLVHNYFRDVPTLSTALISTGTVDKFLFQGFLGGVHVQATRHLTLYTNLGHSKKTGDANRALDQVFGATWSDMGSHNMRVDYHYSKFASSFAQGNYQIVSFSRYFTNRVLWDAQVGHQNLASGFTLNNHSTFVDSSFDAQLLGHSYMQTGYTISRGDQLNYYQWYVSLGYRFDVKEPGR